MEVAVTSAEELRTVISDTPPGSRRTLYLCYDAHERIATQLRATLIRGVAPGKFLWVQGGMHGDEYDGPAALCALEAELDPASLSGTLLVLPVINRSAFEGQSNASPLDQVNLNRVFGVPLPDSPSVRFGRWLLPLVCTADALVDLHGGGQYLDVCSFATVVRGGLDADAESFKLAAYCGVDYLHEKPCPDNGMLIAELARRGIPSVLVEHGGGLEPRRKAIDSHRKAVLQILQHMQMYEDCSAPEPGGVRVQHGADLYFTGDGLLMEHALLGTNLHIGEPILRWRNLETGEDEVLNSPMEGILLSVHTCALVQKGRYAAMIGFKN